MLQTVDEFEEELNRDLQEQGYAGVRDGIMPEGYLEAPLAYDAIWAVALGKTLHVCIRESLVFVIMS